MDVIYIENRKCERKCQLRLSKIDKSNALVGLKGAIFDLYILNMNSGEFEPIVRNITTDLGGIVYLDVFRAGVYKLVEIKAPDNYKLPITPETIFKIDESHLEILQNLITLTIQIPNERISGTIDPPFEPKPIEEDDIELDDDDYYNEHGNKPLDPSHPHYHEHLRHLRNCCCCCPCRCCCHCGRNYCNCCYCRKDRC